MPRLEWITPPGGEGSRWRREKTESVLGQNNVEHTHKIAFRSLGEVIGAGGQIRRGTSKDAARNCNGI